MRRIYLIRHGLPEKSTSEKVYIGVTDIPLSTRGSAEAAQLGSYFLKHIQSVNAVERTDCTFAGKQIRQDISNVETRTVVEQQVKLNRSALTIRILTSPLQRCRQTAEEIQRVLFDGGIRLPEPIVVEALHEINLGEWEGKRVQEIREHFPEVYEARGRALGTYHTPGGESFLEAGVRFQNAMEEILEESDRSGILPFGKRSEAPNSDGNESDHAGEKDARLPDSATSEILLIVAHAGVIRAYLSLLMGRDLNHLMDIPLPYASVTELEVDQQDVEDEALYLEKTDVVGGRKVDGASGSEAAGIKTCREGICVAPDGIGVRPEEMLDAAEITRLYQKYETPKQVIRHMRKVAELAMQLMDGIQMRGTEIRSIDATGEDTVSAPSDSCVLAVEMEKAAVMPGLNRVRVMKACLLHDLCRAEKEHARVSAEAIRKEGYPAIAALVAGHHEAAYSEREAQGPLTEAEILFYADKRVQEDVLVSVEERFRESRKKCRSPEACAKHDAMLAKTLKIEKKILKNRR